MAPTTFILQLAGLAEEYDRLEDERQRLEGENRELKSMLSRTAECERLRGLCEKLPSDTLMAKEWLVSVPSPVGVESEPEICSADDDSSEEIDFDFDHFQATEMRVPKRTFQQEGLHGTGYTEVVPIHSSGTTHDTTATTLEHLPSDNQNGVPERSPVSSASFQFGPVPTNGSQGSVGPKKSSSMHSSYSRKMNGRSNRIGVNEICLLSM
jgi:hypothetical protein